MTTNTYLSFPGTCEEAFKFYETTLGGKILMTFRAKDAPKEAGCPEESGNTILHTRMAVAGGILMGSDSPPQYYQAPQGFHVNLAVEKPEAAEQIYAALAEGGTQTMPIAETFWAHRFGMCVDKFGTPWMVNCDKPMGG